MWQSRTPENNFKERNNNFYNSTQMKTSVSPHGERLDSDSPSIADHLTTHRLKSKSPYKKFENVLQLHFDRSTNNTPEGRQEFRFRIRPPKNNSVSNQNMSEITDLRWRLSKALEENKKLQNDLSQSRLENTAKKNDGFEHYKNSSYPSNNNLLKIKDDQLDELGKKNQRLAKEVDEWKLKCLENSSDKDKQKVNQLQSENERLANALADERDSAQKARSKLLQYEISQGNSKFQEAQIENLKKEILDLKKENFELKQDQIENLKNRDLKEKRSSNPYDFEKDQLKNNLNDMQRKHDLLLEENKNLLQELENAKKNKNNFNVLDYESQLLKDQNSRLENDFKKIKETEKQLNMELSKCEAKNREMMSEKAQDNFIIDDLKRRITQLESDLKRTNDDLTYYKEKHRELTRTSLSSHDPSKEEQIKKLQENNDKLIEEKKKINLDNIDLLNKLKIMEDDLRSANYDRESKFRLSMESQKNESEHLLKSNTDNRKKIKDLEDAINNLHNENDCLRKANSELAAALKRMNEEYSEEKYQLMEEKNRMSRDLSEFRIHGGTSDKLHQNLEDLKKINAELTITIHKLEAEKNGLKALEYRCIEIEKENSRLSEENKNLSRESFDNKLRYLNQDYSSNEIEVLKKKNNDLLDHINRIQDENSQIKNDLSREKSKAHPYEKTSKGHEETEKSSEPHPHSRIQFESDLKSLEGKFNEAEKERMRLVEENKSLVRESFDNKLKALNYDASQKDIERLRKINEELSNNLFRLQDDHNKMLNEKEELKIRNYSSENLQKEVDILRRSNIELSSSVGNVRMFEMKLTEAEQEKSRLSEENHGLKKKISEFEIQNLNNRYLQMDVDRLKKELQNVNDELQKSMSEHYNFKRQHEKTSAQMDPLNLKLNRKKNRISNLKQQLIDNSQIILKFSNENKNLQDKLSDAHNEIEILALKTSVLEQKTLTTTNKEDLIPSLRESRLSRIGERTEYLFSVGSSLEQTEQFKREKQQMEDMLLKASDDIEKLMKMLNEKNTKIKSLENEIDYLTQRKDLNQSHPNQSNKNLNENEKRSGAPSGGIGNKNMSMDEVTAENLKLKTQIDHLKNENEKLKGEAERLRNQLTMLYQQHAKSGGSDTDKELNDLKLQLINALKQIEEQTENARATAKKTKETEFRLRQQLEVMNRRLQDYELDHNVLKGRLADMEKTKNYSSGKRSVEQNNGTEVMFSAERIAYDTQIMQLKQTVIELDIQVDSLIEENEKFKSLNLDNARQIDILRNKLRQSEDGRGDEHLNIKYENQKLRQENVSFQEQLILLEGQKSEYYEQAQHLKKNNENLRKQIEELTFLCERRKNECANLQRENEEQRNDKNNRQKYNSGNNNYMLQEKIDLMTREIDNLIKERDFYKLNSESINLELSKRNKELIEKIKEVENFKQKLNLSKSSNF